MELRGKLRGKQRGEFRWECQNGRTENCVKKRVDFFLVANQYEKNSRNFSRSFSRSVSRAFLDGPPQKFTHVSIFFVVDLGDGPLGEYRLGAGGRGIVGLPAPAIKMITCPPKQNHQPNLPNRRSSFVRTFMMWITCKK